MQKIIKFCAILLAAGKSKRFKYQTKKQFLEINGKTLIEHVLNEFLKIPQIKQFIIVVPKEDVNRVRQNFKTKYQDLNLKVIAGGEERYESVYNAVKYISADCDYILIHDVARPCVTKQLIKRCIKEISKYDCVIPGIKVYDTVKMINCNSEVIQTLDRNNLVLVQTPQVFKKEILKEVYSKANFKKYTTLYKITDDAQLVELHGVKVKVVSGDRYNIKITTKEDLKLINWLLKK